VDIADKMITTVHWYSCRKLNKKLCIVMNRYKSLIYFVSCSMNFLIEDFIWYDYFFCFWELVNQPFYLRVKYKYFLRNNCKDKYKEKWPADSIDERSKNTFVLVSIGTDGVCALLITNFLIKKVEGEFFKSRFDCYNVIYRFLFDL